MKQPIGSRFNQWIVVFLLSWFLVGLGYWLRPVVSQSSSSQVKVFESVWNTVAENFFDPNFNNVDWSKMKSRYQPQAATAKSTEQLAAIINQMLRELNTSHTHFYTQKEPAYYQIAAIFRQWLLKDLKPFLPHGQLEYTGIGIYTEEIEDKTFIKAILNGSPAEKGRLKVGDQLLSVEVMEREGQKIGYIHIWSYADPLYQQQLEEELVYGRLKDSDGLVWDLRDGWGGASPSYLNLFTAPAPTITTIFRDGVERPQKMQWQKPVVMLVNGGSRSGKEILAYGFRKYDVGQIVGSQTAGAVVAGRPYIMPDGSLLYLAVANVLVDGERLEGKGIIPDVRVSVSLPYAQGVDLQKEQAIETVLQALGKAN